MHKLNHIPFLNSSDFLANKLATKISYGQTYCNALEEN